MNKVVRALKRTWLLPLSLLFMVTGISLAQDVVATYMNSGTYDAAAEALKDAFEAETGLEIELVTAPWDILNQNHITDLVTGTGGVRRDVRRVLDRQRVRPHAPLG